MPLHPNYKRARADRRAFRASRQSGDLPLPSHYGHLLESGIPTAMIRHALLRAQQTGTTADRILITEGYVSAADFYRSVARALSLRFSLAALSVIPELHGNNAARAGFVRVQHAGRRPEFLGAPEGLALERLVRTFDQKPHSSGPNLILTTPTHFNTRLRAAFGHDDAEQATYLLARTAPNFSVKAAPIRPVLIGAGCLLAIFTGLCATYPMVLHGSVAALAIGLFLPAMVLKGVAILTGCSKAELMPALLPDQNLPIYTLLVPLFHEAASVPQLVSALQALDYPRAKLDIKFLLEEDDPETIAAVQAHADDAIIDIIICPNGLPRTKPRALNIGMHYARGSLIVVYDAEDVPAPDQLRLAAAHFAASGPKLGCLQGRLAIDNTDDTWLTRLFTLEYAGLFDVILPGMAALGLPVPLGGTSNHFRRSTLQAVFGWDPWNVTEDADLGLRLARLGYVVRDLASTTLEEATASPAAWLNQRTRWMKGWMQTALVHCRDIRRLRHEMGLMRAIFFWILTMTAVISPLIDPVFSAVTVMNIAHFSRANFASPFTIAACALTGLVPLVGASLRLTAMVLGAKRRQVALRFSDFPLTACYSFLITIAAWRAVWELATSPFEWRKTQHGAAKTSRTGAIPRSAKQGIDQK